MKPKQPKRKDEILKRIIIERIVKLRLDHGYTQEFVIARTGLDISSLETGRTVPTLFSLAILCKFYNVTLEEFFAGIAYPLKD